MILNNYITQKSFFLSKIFDRVSKRKPEKIFDVDKILIKLKTMRY